MEASRDSRDRRRRVKKQLARIDAYTMRPHLRVIPPALPADLRAALRGVPKSGKSA